MAIIHAAHLLNDYSGSPKVLSQLLRGWVAAGHTVNLYTSTATTGFLSGLEGVRTHNNHYRFYRFVPVRLLVLLAAQLYTLLDLLRRVGKGDIVYVNTLLPFGAALAGRLRGARVVYHIHETSVNPLVFKKFLLFWVRLCATEVIYVSEFLAGKEPVGKPACVLYNAIGDDFRKRAGSGSAEVRPLDRVLMVSSLKRYKGVDEFVKVARACSELTFELVVNASPGEIGDYFSGETLPANLLVHPAQRDVHPFYRRADVVMNLSRPDEWQETFGLTALEGMAYGLPVIVPPVGGIAEIVHHELTGYHIDGRNTDEIVKRLRLLKASPLQYRAMSKLAAAYAATFSETRFLAGSLRLLERGASRSRKPYPGNGTIDFNGYV